MRSSRVALGLGAARTKFTLSSGGTSLAAAENHFAFQPGAGLDLNFSPNAGLRFEVDVRSIRNGNGIDNSTEAQGVGAIVLRW